MRRHGLILFLILGISACSPDEEVFIYEEFVLEGVVQIIDTLVIPEGQELVIKPGAVVTFLPGAIIVAYGNLIMEGTKENPITLIAEDPVRDHRIITAKGTCEIFTLKNAEVIDGLITSYQSDNHFENVIFRNTKSLEWNNAVARFWYGQVLIEDCIVDWNNQGEGFLLHSVQEPLVQNCSFSMVPDAVEFINCKHGSIIGNNFENMNDDAVDLNHCFNTLIQDNNFYNVKDRALELGSQGFGPSEATMVINNLFVECGIAVNVKESSFARVENATFYNNGISVEIHTDQDSLSISRAEIYRSVFFRSEQLTLINARSVIAVSDCLSDQALPDGTNNSISKIDFKDPANNDFTLIGGELPTGATFENIGFQMPN